MNEDVLAEERALAQIALRLADLIEDEGVNQRELAHLMALSEGRVSQILSGDENMTVRTIARIANALGKRIDFTFQNQERAGRRPSHLSVLETRWHAQDANDYGSAECRLYSLAT